MWCTDGDMYEGTTILKFEERPIVRDAFDSKKISIWLVELEVDDSYINDEGIEIVIESHFVSRLKELKPIAEGTGINNKGEFSVGGKEEFGKIRLTAISTADMSKKKDVIVEIQSSSEIEPPEPGEV
jgi:hypothetical protein